MVAGSRTPMLVQLLILLVYLYDKNIIGKFLTRFSALAFLGMLVMLTYMLATQKNEKSNEVKYENFESYVEDIGDKGHPIWGAGLGSDFFAKGRNMRLTYTELSYMDILRMYGLPVGLCFIFLFFAPFFWLWKYYPRSQFLKRYGLGYVLFLILSGTNPLLLGSIGLTALSMFMAIVNKISQMERQKEELLSETASAESEEKEDLEPLVVDNCLLR
jgi:Zn-dependent protease